jgi:hypothetical protein
MRFISLATALLVLCTSTGFTQTPDFRIQVWGVVEADFNARVRSYFELRRQLEEGLPALAVSDNPADIWRAERALAARIRIARREARQGAIFSPAISAEFRIALLPVLDARTIDEILDDNPGEFSHRINGTYPKSRSYSTVPASVLALLPALPADIQYRFLGRHLVLHDTRANVIVDRLLCAFGCLAPRVQN